MSQLSQLVKWLVGATIQAVQAFLFVQELEKVSLFLLCSAELTN